MRVYNPSSDRILTFQLQELLKEYRFQKNFHVETYVKAKAQLLNNYMKQCSLKSCIVAVSGGIDSAAVLAIVNYAQTQPDSPIKKIVPLLLPVFNSIGATGQDTATERGKNVCLSQGIAPFVIPLEHPHQVLKENTESIMGIVGEAWAEGQLVAHTRTPTLYYTATLLTQNNLPSIICGTTNRDEGLYLGYFGKASDGLVDVQIISDLHKSEVYQVAKHLGIPEETISVEPTGDMYDGRLDEEVFGASYEFVELYMHYLTLSLNKKESFKQFLNEESKEQFAFLSQNLENMHGYNRHKYFGASPAVHLDLDTMLVPEGWKTNCTFNRPIEKITDTSKFVNIQLPPALPEFFNHNHQLIVTPHQVQDSIVYEIDNLLSEEECAWILKKLDNTDSTWLKVGQYGTQTNFNSLTDPIGSLRKSWYSLEISHIIHQRLSGYIPRLIHFEHVTELSTPHHNWTLTGINPLLRFIRYEKDHFLVPHYDYTYQYHALKKTLNSLIIYLDSSHAQTRFLNDDLTQPWQEKDYSDWNAPLDKKLDDTVIKSFTAKTGSALIFPHRILHDAPAANLENQDTFTKTILRTDLVYEAPYLGFTLK